MGSSSEDITISKEYLSVLVSWDPVVSQASVILMIAISTMETFFNLTPDNNYTVTVAGRNTVLLVLEGSYVTRSLLLCMTAVCHKHNNTFDSH